MGESAEQLKEAGVEVIAVFREEREGVEGLEKIREETETTFTLGVDNRATNTRAYGTRTLGTYVIDSSGVVQKYFPGNVRKRVGQEDLLEAVEALNN